MSGTAGRTLPSASSAALSAPPHPHPPSRPLKQKQPHTDALKKIILICKKGAWLRKGGLRPLRESSQSSRRVQVMTFRVQSAPDDQQKIPVSFTSASCLAARRISKAHMFPPTDPTPPGSDPGFFCLFLLFRGSKARVCVSPARTHLDQA